MDNILSALEKAAKIHMIGIGGISMSALAELLMHHGYRLSGSDSKESSITNKLKAKGAEIFIGQSADNIKDAALVCYTAAIKEDNEELKKARTLGVPVLERAELLGEMMKAYRCPIAVAGTHGKTTTTSMLSLILLSAEKNPTILVGGELDKIGGTLHIGENEHLVFEACEYVESFLNFNPYFSVITNIEEDHLDYFKDLTHIISSFEKFSRLNDPQGAIFVCSDDKNIQSLVKMNKSNFVSYAIYDKNADYIAKNVKKTENNQTEYDIFKGNEYILTVTLNVLGTHNVYNSLGAAVCAIYMGIDYDAIKKGLLEFGGTKRRFEKIGTFTTKDGGVAEIIDDYAHHPTEIKATLEAAKQTGKNYWCVFQPHTYTRLAALLDDFADALSGEKNVIIADVYPARELYTGKIHSTDLATKIKGSTYINDFGAICRFLKDKAQSGDLILFMGAGNINQAGKLLAEKN